MHIVTLENGTVFRLQPLKKEEVDEARLLCDAEAYYKLLQGDEE